MVNGGGTASGGGLNYWDVNYTGSGCTSCDGAYLSGGSGDLTDGVVPALPWYSYENLAGTGPYVGWLSLVENNPVITFHFAAGTTVTGLSVFVDNTTYGGVYAPAAILIDGVNTAFSQPGYGSIGWINFTGLNLTGTSHTLELQQYYRQWEFVGEVTFDGRTSGAVPEPASWALMIAGFGMVGGTLRSRRRASVAA
ncbi:PEP-CTERM sorting domain-containing protein [Polymorphobacter arshaanensis]|uniref:PEP-CTERM sorting domain-containing protein n=2 Tax=Glacieibacterium arshaanense TaxID=2511025 RepID=A0A4Y9EPA1_9SPHN|nr:PEP-CTERM sorting domain-containing protein [Polymorphobacter arshaanensis]